MTTGGMKIRFFVGSTVKDGIEEHLGACEGVVPAVGSFLYLNNFEKFTETRRFKVKEIAYILTLNPNGSSDYSCDVFVQDMSKVWKYEDFMDPKK